MFLVTRLTQKKYVTHREIETQLALIRYCNV